MKKTNLLEKLMIITLVIIILIPFVNIMFYHPNSYINGGDTDWQFSSKKFLSLSFFNWNDVSLGAYNSLSYVASYSMVQYAISLVFGDSYLSERLLIIFYMALLFFFSYKLVNFFIKDRKIISLLISLFYSYNIVFFFFMHHIQFKTLILYTSFPIISFLLFSYIDTGKFKFVLYNSIIFILILIPALGHFPVLLIFYSFVFLFSLVYFYERKNFKSLIVRNIIFSILFSIIILSFLIPSTIVQSYSGLNTLTVQYTSEAIKYRYNDYLNTLQFVGGYGWKFSEKDELGAQSFPYKSLFENSGGVILLIPIFIVFLILCNKPKDKNIIFTILFLTFILLLSSPLFLGLYKFLPNLLIAVIRSFFNFYLILPIMLLILYSYFVGLNNKRYNNLIIILLLLYYIMFIIILINGQFFNQYWYVDQGKIFADKDKIDIINQDKSMFRVINNIPDNNYNPVYVKYGDYFIGPDYYYTLLDNALITNSISPILSEKSLLVSKDIIKNKSYKDPHYNIKYLIENNSINKINGFLPRIYANNLLFKKINPTKYEVYISNISEAQNLSFLESYHKYWGLYLVKTPISNWCKPIEFYNNVQTTECEHTQKFFEGEELSYLYKKSIFDNNHQIVYDYANGWTIDPQYIKDNYSPEYYKQNADGSIDVEIILYFKPQSYFYVGLIISVMVLIICLMYLTYCWRKSKNKSLKTDN